MNTPIRKWEKGYKWEIYTKIYTKTPPNEEIWKKVLRYHIVQDEEKVNPIIGGSVR